MRKYHKVYPNKLPKMLDNSEERRNKNKPSRNIGGDWRASQN